MDAPEELVKRFKEVKIWKKEVTRAAILFMVVGVAAGAAGFFAPLMWWIFLIFGVALVVAGLLFFFISRNIANKAERMTIEILNSAEMPENQREKLKTELGLK